MPEIRNVVDALAAGKSFTTTRSEIRASLAEYEARYGPLDPDTVPGDGNVQVVGIRGDITRSGDEPKSA